MCAIRYRGRYVLYVPGYLRHRLRQVYRRRGSAVHPERHLDHLREPGRLSRGLEDQRAGVHQVRSRSSVSQFSGIRGVSVRYGGRDQEGPEAQAGLFGNARPDAVSLRKVRNATMTDGYEFVAIGSGPAGESAAELAAFFGHRSAVIEKARPGGTVTTTGGVPTKT